MNGIDISICREYHFDSAHRLEWHQGRCKNLHGHTYRLAVWVGGDLDVRGVIMDFEDLDAVVKRAVISRLDHTYLNEIIENPTAERTAMWALERLLAEGLSITEIQLWETPRSAVSLKPSEAVQGPHTGP